MIKSLSGCDPNWAKPLSWLNPAVKGWIEANEQYAKYWEGYDALYWYNERTAVGSLAAGAARAGFRVLEEYASMKSRPETVKKSGLTDLYVGKAANDATLEAKICWVDAGCGQGKLSAALTAACSDARCNRGTKQKVGLVFYVMKMRCEDASEQSLKREINRVREVRSGAVAWCFPGPTRTLATDTKQYKGFVWPGVVMAMRIA